MKRSVLVILATLALVAAIAGDAAPGGAQPKGGQSADHLEMYAGTVPASGVAEIVALGVDRHELQVEAVPGERGAKARVRVEAILSGRQAAELRGKGVNLSPKKVDGQTVTQRAAELEAQGTVFRPYTGAGGLKEEFQQLAADHPKIAKLVTIGQSINGKDIVALRVTENARTVRDGIRPAVLYLGAQHAREWITPEMIRRLAHHILDGAASDPAIQQLVKERELWFLPVANPDGYDFTFQPGNRLWRKNLHDNNGDGVITPGDGVDPNRNFATRWGYDNEGSSPIPASETFRGAGPQSEPETQALDAFAGRIGFEYLVNYHSAAELLLYGIGWQVATASPDDVIYEALAGDDAHPAVPDYDPDLSAELYTTNGDTDLHMTERYGTLSFTPEMATCATASARNPNDQWDPNDCGSVFEFPDDEALIQQEFENNIPFALSVAQSAKDPDDPVSSVGRTAEDFRIDPFEVSYGDPQPVAVTAKRALKQVRMRYRINGGAVQTTGTTEWQGGERYGDESDIYYAERRGSVSGASPGDAVEVWFDGIKPGTGPVESAHFTYTLQQDTGHRVLVLANEDYSGVNPTYPEGTTAPKYLGQYVAAVEAAGFDADTWDVDAQGVPHDLGVLSHYDGIVWYLGDNRITQDPEDEFTSTPFGPLPEISVAERQQYLTLAVRDFLNEGGKLVHAGETAQYQGLSGISDVVGGLYYGLNGDPSAPCVVATVAGFFEDCLILNDDFRQYYLGAMSRTSLADPDSVAGVAPPVAGFQAALGGPVVEGDNPLDEAGLFVPTSDVLPVSAFPQFASRAAMEYPLLPGSPFVPVEGQRYAGAVHANYSYMRLTRTIDLTGATSASLRFQLSLDAEPGYDHLIVEAHTPGQDDWTTLPDSGGGTTTTPPTECVTGGFLLTLHPFLKHYIGGADCTGPGTSGTWNSVTGSTDGWRQAAYDLSAFVGHQVEVSIAYVTDPNTGGAGAFVDDTQVVVDGNASADGFEGQTSAWSPAAPPAGSPDTGANWQIGGQLFHNWAGTSTDDTLLVGFGLEQLATNDARRDLLGLALGNLLGAP